MPRYKKSLDVPKSGDTVDLLSVTQYIHPCSHLRIRIAHLTAHQWSLGFWARNYPEFGRQKDGTFALQGKRLLGSVRVPLCINRVFGIQHGRKSGSRTSFVSLLTMCPPLACSTGETMGGPSPSSLLSRPFYLRDISRSSSRPQRIWDDNDSM